VILGLEFPPLSHIVNWPEFIGGDTWGVNKVVVIYLAAVLLTVLLFSLGNKKQLVPTGAQNLAEVSVEFVQDEIILPTMGAHVPKWVTPFMISLFFYIFFCNIFEIIPVMQMPATARIAVPMFLALLTWVIFNASGIASQGLFGYLKSSLFPPGTPALLYILVTPIEFVSTFLVRPFSLMVRLFANLLAGHILLVTFAVLSAGLFTAQWYAVFWPLPAFAVVFFTAFEVLVSVLQAYVFTLLAGVYIGGAMHPEH
jgi:F-type H+-transporting ATPase subunit a